MVLRKISLHKKLFIALPARIFKSFMYILLVFILRKLFVTLPTSIFDSFMYFPSVSSKMSLLRKLFTGRKGIWLLHVLIFGVHPDFPCEKIDWHIGRKDIRFIHVLIIGFIQISLLRKLFAALAARIFDSFMYCPLVLNNMFHLRKLFAALSARIFDSFM